MKAGWSTTSGGSPSRGAGGGTPGRDPWARRPEVGGNGTARTAEGTQSEGELAPLGAVHSVDSIDREEVKARITYSID